jgi:GTP-binding protein LepA
MVFCGLFPIDGDEYAELRESLEKLQLNDSSFTYAPETSGALGFGFRCGFLGLLHMDIVRERLEREFDLTLIATAPSVEYLAHVRGGQVIEVDNPAAMPPGGEIEFIEEPMLKVTILTPAEYTGTLMDLCQQRRGEMIRMEYLSPERVELDYKIPLAEVVMDFFDALKSRTKGYASLDYEPAGYVQADLVKLDVLLNGVPVDAFSSVLHKSKAYEQGKKIVLRRRHHP